MATKITTRVLADDAVTDAKIADVTLTTATQSASDNTTKIATTAYVTTAIANLADSAPSTLNTLNELAAALGDDANYATTTTNAIAAKLPLAGGTLTGNLLIGHTSSFAHADADNLAIGDGTNNSGLTIYTGSSKESSIIFGNAGTNGNIEAGIKYYHESHGTVANRRAMTFATGGSMAERMRIDSSGKVMIGSTNPGVGGTIDLSVGSTSSSGGITLWSPTNSAHSIGFGDGYTGTDRYRGYLEYLHSSDSMRFGTSATERIRITSAGKVGIGTTAPNLKLHVEEDADTWVGEFKNVRSAGGYGLRIDNTGAGGATDTRYALGVYTPGNTGFFVRNNGNVGIGTTTPSTTLQVNASGGGNLLVSRTGSAGGLYIESDGTNGVIRNPANSPLLFQTNGANTRMKIHADGKVEFNGGPVKGMRQAVQYQGATNSTSISANSNATFQSTTITTTGNSKLVVWAHSGQILKLQMNSNPWMRIAVNGTYIGAAHEGHHYWYGISSGTSQRLFLTEFGVSGTLAAGTHTVTMVGGTYAADMTFNYQNQSGHMVIMEVGA